MITVITRFAVPVTTNTSQMRAALTQAAPAFRNVPGLIRKQFLLSADGQTAGGVYWWQEEEAARSFMQQRVAPMIREKYQVEPTIEFYDSPAVVDANCNDVGPGGTARDAGNDHNPEDFGELRTRNVVGPSPAELGETMSVLRFVEDTEAQKSTGETNMAKHARHARQHAIRWTSKTSGRMGTGTNRFTREEAETLAAELNKEYPEIEHEVVLVVPPPTETIAVSV